MDGAIQNTLRCSQLNMQVTSLRMLPSPSHLIMHVLSSTRKLPHFACSLHHHISLCMSSVQHASYLTSHVPVIIAQHYVKHFQMPSVQHKSYLTFTFCHTSSSWHFIAIFTTFVSMFSTFLIKSAHHNVLLVNTYCCYMYVTATFQINYVLNNYIITLDSNVSQWYSYWRLTLVKSRALTCPSPCRSSGGCYQPP
jgi:hypothetical protein